MFFENQQEFIFKRVEGFHFGLYLTFLQFLQYVVISGRQLMSRTVYEPRRAPLSDYALIGFLSVTTMALSNISIQYLNFPTQVCFALESILTSLFEMSPIFFDVLT